MKALMSYSPESDRYIVELRPISGSSTRHQLTSDGAEIWFSVDGDMEVVALSDDSSITARRLFGDGWETLRASLRDPKNDNSTIEVDVSAEIGLAPARPDATLVKRPDVPALASALGDGAPREIPAPDGAEELRAATVELPEESGAENLSEPRTARIVWNQSTGEMKVQIPLRPGSRSTLWVRVGDGESGDLIALARPERVGDRDPIASTIVPTGRGLGELYVDVTDEPLAVIGSSRLRTRRRAARLEAHAARLTSEGRGSQASAYAAHAAELRRSLGDVSRPRKSRRSWWMIPVIIALLAVIAVLAADGEQPAAPVGLPQVTDVRVLAYEAGRVAFSGPYPYSVVAAEIVERTSLKVQVYDQAVFVFGGGSISDPIVALDACEGTIGSSTGASAGGYSIPISLIVLGSDDRSRTTELLSAESWKEDEVIGRLETMTVMTGNLTEGCLPADGDVPVRQVTRQVYGVESIPLKAETPRFLVVRIVQPDGSALAWSSDDVISVR